MITGPDLSDNWSCLSSPEQANAVVPPRDLTVGLSPYLYGVPGEVGVSYERGTPVNGAGERCAGEVAEGLEGRCRRG